MNVLCSLLDAVECAQGVSSCDETNLRPVVDVSGFFSLFGSPWPSSNNKQVLPNQSCGVDARHLFFFSPANSGRRCLIARINRVATTELTFSKRFALWKWNCIRLGRGIESVECMRSRREAISRSISLRGQHWGYVNEMMEQTAACQDRTSICVTGRRCFETWPCYCTR